MRISIYQSLAITTANTRLFLDITKSLSCLATLVSGTTIAGLERVELQGVLPA